MTDWNDNPNPISDAPSRWYDGPLAVVLGLLILAGVAVALANAGEWMR